MAVADPSPSGGDVLLDVRNLTKHFPVTKGLVFQRTVGHVKAVDGVSFTIRRGEALGLVGESGCGKTTVARCVLELLDSTDGQILFDGEDLGALDRPATKRYRRRDPFEGSRFMKGTRACLSAEMFAVPN